MEWTGKPRHSPATLEVFTDTRDLKSWKEFSEEIEKISQQYGTHELAGRQVRNQILYRGHSDSKWRLTTTLERFSNTDWSILLYLHVADLCKPELESYLDRSWNIPDWPELERSLRERLKSGYVSLPHYDYLVFLRHHGFPSPLLDWSKSAYIAAFFAFEERVEAERAAIFAYIETPAGTKGGTSGSPQVTVQGPYVRTHKRHFVQQAQYTVATEIRNGEHFFVSHETVFRECRADQDVLIKLTLPRSERPEVLRALYDYNITRFSLFQTDEALVRTLAYKEMETRDL
jgi:hypothetical protein